MKKKDRSKIVIISNKAYLRNQIRQVLEKEKHQILGEGLDGHDAISLYRRHNPEIMIIDLDLPLLDGIEASDIIVKRYKEAKILLIYDSYNRRDEAVSVGIMSLLRKPIEAELLVSKISNMIKAKPPGRNENILASEERSVSSFKKDSNIKKELIPTNNKRDKKEGNKLPSIDKKIKKTNPSVGRKLSPMQSNSEQSINHEPIKRESTIEDNFIENKDDIPKLVTISIPVPPSIRNKQLKNTESKKNRKEDININICQNNPISDKNTNTIKKEVIAKKDQLDKTKESSTLESFINMTSNRFKGKANVDGVNKDNRDKNIISSKHKEVQINNHNEDKRELKRENTSDEIIKTTDSKDSSIKKQAYSFEKNDDMESVEDVSISKECEDRRNISLSIPKKPINIDKSKKSLNNITLQTDVGKKIHKEAILNKNVESVEKTEEIKTKEVFQDEAIIISKPKEYDVSDLEFDLREQEERSKPEKSKKSDLYKEKLDDIDAVVEQQQTKDLNRNTKMSTKEEINIPTDKVDVEFDEVFEIISNTQDKNTDDVVNFDDKDELDELKSESVDIITQGESLNADESFDDFEFEISPVDNVQQVEVNDDSPDDIELSIIPQCNKDEDNDKECEIEDGEDSEDEDDEDLESLEFEIG